MARLKKDTNKNNVVNKSITEIHTKIGGQFNISGLAKKKSGHHSAFKQIRSDFSILTRRRALRGFFSIGGEGYGEASSCLVRISKVDE